MEFVVKVSERKNFDTNRYKKYNFKKNLKDKMTKSLYDMKKMYFDYENTP